MARITVDNSGEIFGSTVTLADLAQHSFQEMRSDIVSIYYIDGILSVDWRDELQSVEMEYLTGVSATFKDGSIIHVGAWADGDEKQGREAGARFARFRQEFNPARTH